MPGPRRMTLATLTRPEDGGFIDQALVVFFPGPGSYTGEDLVELHLHGGLLVVQQTLAALARLGARPAEPGEFTMRAFLAGKMDLLQAEAVAGLVDAESDAELEMAGRHLAGRTSAFLQPLQDNLTLLLDRLEAELDFPEDVPELKPEELEQQLADLSGRLRAMASTFASTNRTRTGLRVVLAGQPNVGKSALFNALLGHARALVTREPGTTRDYLEEQLLLDGKPLVLVDTAGLRQGEGLAEQEGIQRSLEQIDQAQLVLVLMDQSLEEPQSLELLTGLPTQSRVVVLNKSDLAPGGDWVAELCSQGALLVSAADGQGIDSLVRLLRSRVRENAPGPEQDALWLISERQRDNLDSGADFLERAGRGVGELPWEILASLVRQALQLLEETTGVRPDQDSIDRIFSSFCIGK